MIRRDYQCDFCNLEIPDMWEDAAECPACGSKDLTQIFLSAPGKLSAMTKFTDSGIRKNLESYGLTDFTNNESQTHDPTPPNFWGGQISQKDIEKTLKTGQLPQQAIAGIQQRFGIQGATLNPTSSKWQMDKNTGEYYSENPLEQAKYMGVKPPKTTIVAK